MAGFGGPSLGFSWGFGVGPEDGRNGSLSDSCGAAAASAPGTCYYLYLHRKLLLKIPCVKVLSTGLFRQVEA
jgi:hypothetical protein